MKFSEFEAKVSATLADYMKKFDLNGQYMHLALGIHEESGEVTTLIRLAVVLQTAVIQGLIPVIIITRAAHLMAMVIYREGVLQLQAWFLVSYL